MIRFEDVTKRYDGSGGAVAVDDLTLEARRGEITVLVGPSGCGKTTTLRMINRLIEPTSGRILLDEKDTSSLPAAELRRGIGYVIQHAGLFPHRTVLANVMTVPKLLGWSTAKAQERAREVLELVGLDAAAAERYPSQLSGGQQQRVGVARALATDPPVLLMDEPFSAVDPVVREGLQDEFLRLQAELGTTIVMVTHDIDEAIKLGHRIAVLRVGGKLAQIDSPSALLAHPADDFVADFLGRDRGYRALGFHRADVPVHPEATVRLDAAVAAAGGQGPWVLVVDDAGTPQGWYDTRDADGGGDGTAASARLNRGGTVARADGSLRALLDAALSSPSGRGVVVDDAGAVVGTVRAREVLSAIEGTDMLSEPADVGAARADTAAQGGGGA